jgi:hypothetical protein
VAKPKIYVINLGNNLFYQEDSAWLGVSKVQATKLSHKDAYTICNRLKSPKMGYNAFVELADKT